MKTLLKCRYQEIIYLLIIFYVSHYLNDNIKKEFTHYTYGIHNRNYVTVYCCNKVHNPQFFLPREDIVTKYGEFLLY